MQTGVSYLSQVLKRNRTLKILNLADNKIGTDGLEHIADALVRLKCVQTLHSNLTLTLEI
jgi:Ran GTPase-activating protein (RanGAP) involved in mRNA processing and transport